MLGVVGLPVAWFSTRPETDVGRLDTLESGGAAAVQTPEAPARPATGDDVPEFEHHSARLGDQVQARRAVPQTIQVPDIGIDAPVAAIGVAPDNQLEVPTAAAVVGWYRHGASPGQEGSAVLAGHVDYDGAPGVFIRLGQLNPGATITVGYDDGSQGRFSVVARRQYDKSELPTESLFSEDGAPSLVLVTCGGDFDGDVRSYRDNVVVYATPLP